MEVEHPTPWTTNDFVLHVHLGTQVVFFMKLGDGATSSPDVF